MLTQQNGHVINNHDDDVSSKCAEIESTSAAPSDTIDVGSMAAATDTSVAEIHNGCTPVETSNSSAGMTTTTTFPADENGDSVDPAVDTADADGLGTVVPQTTTKRGSRCRRYDDLDDMFTSADESEIDPLHGMRGGKYGDVEKDAVSGSNVLELDDDGDRWSKDFDRESQTPSTRKVGSAVRGVVVAVLLLGFLIGAAGAAILINRRLKGEVSYEFHFARYYGNHMVLQRSPGRAIVWGYGPNIDGNTTVSVKLTNDAGFYREKQSVVKYTAAGWTWKVMFDPIEETGPFLLNASLEGYPNYELQLHDVLFGDVWLCVGQNKLHYSIDRLLNSTGDVLTDRSFQEIRLFSLFQANSDMLWHDLRGVTLPWSVPKSVATTVNRTVHTGSHFPAVCWLFGKQLHSRLNRPIGLISATFGDSQLEEWVPSQVIDQCHVKFTDSSSRIWNGMINPLLEMPFYGAIWHQGTYRSCQFGQFAEARTAAECDMLERQRNHSCVIPSLISHWRQMASDRTFNSTSPLFPVGIIQPSPRGDAELESQVPRHLFSNSRWYQTANYGFLPNPAMPKTFLVVTIDLPDVVTNHSTHSSVHLHNKHDIVSRLILGAMSVAYATPGIVFQGPWPDAYQLAAGRSLMLFFSNTSLYVPNHTGYSGFEVCCSENTSRLCQDAHPATAGGSEWLSAHITTVRAEPSTLTLSVSSCPSPRYVVGLRYAWRKTPCPAKQCPIYSSATPQLPMPPYIRFGLRQDNVRHELDRAPVDLV